MARECTTLIDTKFAKTLAEDFRIDGVREATVSGVHTMQTLCHSLSVVGGWWHDPKTGEPLARNCGEMLCLIHSEVSEAMEGERKGLMDDKLPHREMAEVELADAVIRIFDYAEAKGYSVAEAIIEKLKFNSTRPDHKPENRVKAGGKTF